ncbi:MAG: transcriptional regulator, MerR family [Frankiales bacterium]|nr:transcriptional regulator, MerR family [Frankiales bacterium]
MTAVNGLPARSFMSIGEVLAQLRQDFPDITISKIRFLEAEGLVEPERTASGYRKFSREDVGRLRYVLSAQRDQYLPLRVIKEHLDAIDRGLEPPAAGGAGPRVPRALVAAEGLPTADAFRPDASEVRLSRRELLDAAGLEEAQLEQLEQYGLLGPRTGTSHYDGDALVVAKTVAEMSRFGIEARHLRPFKAAAEREIGLVEQVVTPLVRQRGPEARARADEVARELAALSVKLHATLVRAGLGPGLRR